MARKLGTRQKAQADAAFQAACERALRDLGATPNEPGAFHGYSIETRAGALAINVYPTSLPEPGGWLAMRFADVERARALGLSALNPHSGKYNIDSLYGEADPAIVTAEVIRHVRRAL
jgi:hypothetical protein